MPNNILVERCIQFGDRIFCWGDDGKYVVEYVPKHLPITKCPEGAVLKLIEKIKAKEENDD